MYKYQVWVEINGIWTRYGESDSNSNAIAHDINDELPNCGRIKFVENTLDYEIPQAQIDISNPMKLYGAI